MKNIILLTLLWGSFALPKAHAQGTFIMDTTINGQKYEKLKSHWYLVKNTANYLYTIEYKGPYEPKVTVLSQMELDALVKKYIYPYVQDNLEIERRDIAFTAFAITFYLDTKGILKELGFSYSDIWEKIPMSSLAALEQEILKKNIRFTVSKRYQTVGLPWIRHVVLYGVPHFKKMGQPDAPLDLPVAPPIPPKNGGKLPIKEDGQ
ncbi:MAG: hypothetical protein LBR65_07765 [Culturomica sp.]|jgi:hypothetical protein|nr:hypothetical protein [Culturomica sp.]